MSKPPKKKACHEKITISKIYEEIQNRNFRQELWHDLVSDIEEKPTYKRIKRMVDSLINETVCEPVDESNDNVKRRTAVTEISIMTYTLDRVISEVLHRTFESEFKNIVTSIINECLDEKNLRNTSSTSDSLTADTITSNIDHHKNGDTEASPIPTNQEVLEKPTIKKKRGRPKKILQDDSSPKTKVKGVRGRKKGWTCKTILSPDEARKKLDCGADVKTEEISKQNSKRSKTKKITDPVSDADSELSLDSISSVHTSELSSFEDCVSVGSDDEDSSLQKKKIPLKIASDLYLNGKLSEIYYIGKKAEEFKNSSLSKKHKTSKTSSDSVSSDTTSKTATKIPAKRGRKPKNASASTNNLKEDNSIPPPSSNPKSSKETDRADGVKQPVSTSEISNSKPHASSGKVTAKLGSISPARTSSKRYDPSDLYKPRPVFGKLSSQL